MKSLVNDPVSQQFLDDTQHDSTLRALLGDAATVDTMVRPDFLSARMELRSAVQKVAGLAEDPTRTEVSKHGAAKRVADALLSKLEKVKGAMEARAKELHADALRQADLALGPKADRGHLEGEIRDWLFEVSRKEDGLLRIKKEMRESEDLARVLWHSPRFLLNLPEETHAVLRFEVLQARHPELYGALQSAMHLEKLAGKFEAAIAKAGRAFYSPPLAAQAAKRVEV